MYVNKCPFEIRIDVYFDKKILNGLRSDFPNNTIFIPPFSSFFSWVWIWDSKLYTPDRLPQVIRKCAMGLFHKVQEYTQHSKQDNVPNSIWLNCVNLWEDIFQLYQPIHLFTLKYLLTIYWLTWMESWISRCYSRLISIELCIYLSKKELLFLF